MYTPVHHSSASLQVARTLIIRTTLTTIRPCPLPKKQMIIMGHVVLDRLRLERTMFVALALLTIPKSQVFAFSLNPSAMWTKLWLSTMASKTYQFIVAAGVLRTMGRPWVLLHILSRSPFSMALTMAAVEKVRFLSLQVVTVLGTAINVTLMVTQTAYTPSLSLPLITRANIHGIPKPAQPT